jgi:hypothetical protein
MDDILSYDGHVFSSTSGELSPFFILKIHWNRATNGQYDLAEYPPRMGKKTA